MANYDAQINILVAGQRNIQNLANQLNAIEDSIEQIERRWRSATGALQRANIRLGVTGTQQPRGEGGRFARDPDRRARQLAFQDRRRALIDQRLARLAVFRERAQAVAARSSIDNNRELIRQTERRITLESRLNSANELFQRRVQQFSRGGAGRGLPENLQQQARSIQAAYDAAGGAGSRNIRLIQSLATELGRVVERQNEFNRLQSLGSKGFEAGRRLQERITSAASGVDLPAQRVRNARSLATQVISASRSGDQQAYSEAVRRATAAISRLERESKELADAINEQENEIRRIARIAPRSPVRGGRNFPGSPIAEEIALREAQKGFPASPIRGTATMAGSPKAIAAQQKAQEIALKQSQRGFPASPIGGTATMPGSPKFLAAQERARSAAERALRAQERSAKAAESAANKEADRILKESQKGFPSSPIMGTATMAGSPKAIAAQERNRVAAERRAAAQRRAEERAAKVQQQVAIAAERAADKALREAQKGFPSSPILGSATIEGSPRWRAAQESARQKLESAARAAERAADRALKEAQKGFPSSPILGTATMAGSPRWMKAQERLRERASATGFPSSPIRGGIGFPGSPIFNETPFLERRFGRRGAAAISEGLIGGAFPLLFGQGIGAAALGGAGGALGGFAGGGLGFGLSLVGTALGTAFDTAVQGAIELGAALEKPAENFDQLAQKSFFSSKALEDTIKKTIEYGDTATASALIQQEAIKKLGVGGVQNLKVLGTESDRLNRAFAELGQQMQAVAAGPLASVIGFFANIAGQAAAAGRVRLLRANLNEQQAGQFNQEILGRLKERGIERGFFAPSTPTESEVGMLQDQGALQDIVDKWQAIQIKGQIKIDRKQRIESEINALEKRLEFLDIGKSLKDQFRSAAREQQDLDKQRADLVRSYEESIANIRKQVEDEIRNKRFATLEKENQLLDAQGQIRLKQLQIANQAAVAQAGAGQRPEVEQAAKEVAQLVAQFTEQQVSAEEQAASIKRNAALDVQKIDSEAAQFKASIEKEVARLNVETARRVADINEQVRRRNEEADTRRFSVERNIAVLKLRLFQDELALATKDLSLPEQARNQAASLYRAVERERLEVEKLNAPPALRGVGAVGGGGVSTAGLDRATADYRIAVENYVAAQLRLNELDVVKNAQDFALGIAEFANKTDATLTAIQTRESDAEIERLRYIELINAGLTDTVAQKVIELETTKRVALAVYDTAIAQLENKIIAGEVTAEVDAQNKAYLDQIKILKERKDALEGKFGEVDTTTGKGTGAVGEAIESDRGKKIQDFIAQATAELNDLEAVAVRVSQGIGDAVGNSIANGISGLIEGTTTAKEVFADFLKDVGDILIKEGTRMIAMYIAIGIAKMFAGLTSGGSESAKNFEMPGEAFIPKGGFKFPGAANGAYFANGIAAFANGGMFTNSVISSPTLFQFADGGVTRTGLMGEAGPEAIMPLERGADGKLGVKAKLSGAMTRYRRPPGTDAAPEPGSGDSGSGGGGAAVAAPIDVRYTVERINSVDFVTADQFQRGMAQAAQQGATQGERRALTTLRQNTSQRKRIGI